MYVFIAIIFTAELIIAFSLISWIVSADKIVKSLDKKSDVYGPVLIDNVKSVRKSISLVQTSILKSIEIFNRKRAEFRQKLVNFIIIYIILFILKTKFKKTATFCQYAILLKDCWDGLTC